MSSTRPITSSATAAPSTVRASTRVSAPRSLNTRAVMPTLVAASAAPTNSAVSLDSPNPSATPKPIATGTTTPIVATVIDDFPTDRRSPRLSSRPTSSSSRITPSSPRTSSVMSWPTSDRTDGPMMMPARISPTTAGMPTRSASSAASFAASRTTRMSTRTSVTLTRCCPLLRSGGGSRGGGRCGSGGRSARSAGAGAPCARRARCGPSASRRASRGAGSVSRLTTAF